MDIFQRISISNRTEKKQTWQKSQLLSALDFPFSSLSVLVKYNTINVEQTPLMVPANKLKPQTLNPFIFVFLPIFHRSCQLGLSLDFPKVSLHVRRNGKWGSLHKTMLVFQWNPSPCAVFSAVERENPTSMLAFWWSWSQRFMISVLMWVDGKRLSKLRYGLGKWGGLVSLTWRQ